MDVSDPLDLNLREVSELRDLRGLSGSFALAVSSMMKEFILLILSFTDDIVIQESVC